MFEQLGIVAIVTELWNPLRQAGIVSDNLIGWFRDHPPADDLALLRWSDAVMGRGGGYVDPFEHPQLGSVELGGWDSFRVWWNPPASLMESEIGPHASLALLLLQMSPRLELRSSSAQSLGGGTWYIRLVVQNSGWLSTNVTSRALELNVVKPVEAEIILPFGASMVAGSTCVELGQLSGRSAKLTAIFAGEPTSDRAKAEWVVRGVVAGTVVPVMARHPRAGVVRTEIVLPNP